VKKTGFSFLFINRIRQTICSKRCFLTTKREIEIRLYSSGKQRLQSYSVSDKVNIPVHWTLYTIIPVFPLLIVWEDGDLYWMIDSTEIY